MGDNNAYGFFIDDAEIDANQGHNPVGVLLREAFKSTLQLNRARYGGRPESAIRVRGKGVVTVSDSNFVEWGARFNRRALDIYDGLTVVLGSHFMSNNQILTRNTTITNTGLISNTYDGAVPTSERPSSLVKIGAPATWESETDSTSYVPPAPSRPQSSHLYNVLDYGDEPSADGDNTASFQSALNAASALGLEHSFYKIH